VRSFLINSIDCHVRDHHPRRTPHASYFLIYGNLIHRSKGEDTNALHSGVSDNLATCTCIKLNNSLSSYVTFSRVILVSRIWPVNSRPLISPTDDFPQKSHGFAVTFTSLSFLSFTLRFKQDWRRKLQTQRKAFPCRITARGNVPCCKIFLLARIFFILELCTNSVSTLLSYTSISSCAIPAQSSPSSIILLLIELTRFSIWIHITIRNSHGPINCSRPFHRARIVNRSQKFPIPESGSEVIEFHWSLRRLLSGKWSCRRLRQGSPKSPNAAARCIHAASVTRSELCEVIPTLEYPRERLETGRWTGLATRPSIIRGHPRLIARARSQTRPSKCLRAVV